MRRQMICLYFSELVGQLLVANMEGNDERSTQVKPTWWGSIISDQGRSLIDLVGLIWCRMGAGEREG